MPKKMIFFEDDPSWYKDAVIYELHVKAFFDSNGDGKGDFQGLTQRLDYLEGLGITALWILPFYPSPFRDDGYDIADYFSVHPDYGNIREFKEFIGEAHRRGIRVITELVLNHTSDQHAWFQRARKAPSDSPHRDFYVWSDSPDRYKDARIIFQDFETSNWTWDPVAKAYFWHRFYSHQPDLNFHNPHVKREVFRVIDFWMDMGVDGMRLDAVPYLFEEEGTNCENLPDTYEFLKKLRVHIDRKYKSRMLLAEANQWPEDAAAYFGQGDICHMNFHFPLMPRLFMSLWMEDGFPIVDIFDQTPAIPDSCQWALFLRNHDELTLEMVTDEERDYMYKVYARDPRARINLGIRRRLAPLLGNNRRRIELMNILLFSLPGTPVIYYGDEIGMGDNFYLGDRNGVRTPMQWSADKNSGFSRSNPQGLFLPLIIDPEYHYEAVNVENQERNETSLLWWMKRIIAMRKRFRAFGRGSIKFILTNNPKVLVFMRQYQEESILVVVNFSRFSQVVELDLSEFAGSVPEEVFGGNRFPHISSAPYVLTLGMHDYYWFALQREEAIPGIDGEGALPELAAAPEWERVLAGKEREKLERSILPAYLKRSRWYGGKARKINQLQIVEDLRLERNDPSSRLLFLELRYHEGLSDAYLLPMAFATGEEADQLLKEFPQSLVARLRAGGEAGLLYDATYRKEFRAGLFRLFAKKQFVKGAGGTLAWRTGKKFKDVKGLDFPPEKSRVLKTEQSNSSLIFGNEIFLKLYRRLEEGLNPELDIGMYLTDKISFPNTPPFLGALEYLRKGAKPLTVALLQGLVPNQGDAWTYSLDSLGRYFERILSRLNEVDQIAPSLPSIQEIQYEEIPQVLLEVMGGDYLEMIRLLGKRTAELHQALASNSEDPDFAPEPFSLLYQRSLYQSMQSLTKKTMELLKKNMGKLPEEGRDEAAHVLGLEKNIVDQFKNLFSRNKKISSFKIRIHGDYHLGQVLFTGNDFIIIDFEGEPARSLSERRLKRSALRDVAGMLRSFHYAACHTLHQSSAIRPQDVPRLKPWAETAHACLSGIFLDAYLKEVGKAVFVPQDREEFTLLLRAFLLEKSVYELGYELNHRPGWTRIPLEGIRRILEK